MGWMDREPHFSQITNRQDELEEEGMTRTAAWEIAYDECVDRLQSVADDERKRLKGE